MAEAIHCPSCSTRYRLQAKRLRPGIHRAKCFSCGSLFPISEVVQRLLAPALPTDTARFLLKEVNAAQRVPAKALEPPPSLTAGDLEGVEEEILEKTLMEAPSSLPETKVEPAPARVVLPDPWAPPEAADALEPVAEPKPAIVPAPEAPAPAEPATPLVPEAPAPAFPRELTEATLSGYSSARDAIDKLLGHVPAAAPGPHLQSESSSMDMETALSNLDSTLGGPRTSPLATTGAKGDSPTALGLTEEDLAGPSASTLRLSRADLEAALAAPPRAKQEEPTAALRPSDLVVLPEGPGEATPLPAPKRVSFPSTAAHEANAELLRLKIGEEIYSNLTMAQLIAWVEEGRIIENHLVARQHSENWLEAHKVPGLRPVFERLRRERNEAIGLDASYGDYAPKKSLFGGLFGKA